MTDYNFSDADAARAKVIAHQLIGALPERTQLNIQLLALNIVSALIKTSGGDLYDLVKFNTEMLRHLVMEGVH